MPLIFVFVIFYFLLIRPQQKRQKDHEKLVASIKTGDKIVTSSGIHGIVANVKEKTLLVKVADNVKIEFDRSSVAAVEKSAKLQKKSSRRHPFTCQMRRPVHALSFAYLLSIAFPLPCPPR